MSKTRRHHTPKFKARLALAALSGRQTIASLAQKHGVHRNLIRQWQQQLQDQAESCFSPVQAPTASQSPISNYKEHSVLTAPSHTADQHLQAFVARMQFADAYVLFERLKGIQYWMKDADSRYIHVNAAFLENYSLDNLADVRGKSDFELSPHHLAERFHQDDLHILQSGEAICNRLELVGNHSGTVQWFNTSKCALRHHDGRIIGSTGITFAIDDDQVSAALYGDMGPVIHYIKANVHLPISMSDLADILQLSISAFERRFKRFFQCSPVQYIKRIRIRLVCEMLVNTNNSLTDIAIECGFCDHSYMTKEFKRLMDCTPRQYRQRFIHDQRLSAHG